MRPGDLIAVRTDHLVSRLIRFGQREYGPAAARWNHIAVYIGEGLIVEALTQGVVVSELSKYSDWIPLNADLAADDRMRENACHFALDCVGERYGWLTIAAIAVKALTKGRIDFGVSGTSICSGLGARCWERLGYDWNPYDPAELTPAYLVRKVMR